MWSDADNDDDDDENEIVIDYNSDIDLSDTSLIDLDNMNETDLQNFVVNDSESETNTLALVKRAKRLNREKEDRLTQLKKTLEMFEARLSAEPDANDEDADDYSEYEEFLKRVSGYLNKTGEKNSTLAKKKGFKCFADDENDAECDDEDEGEEDNTAVALYTFGMPYFKDNINHSFRKHDEWLRMDEMGIRFLIYFEPVFSWDKVMVSRLERAVYTFLPSPFDPKSYRDTEHAPLIDWFKISDQVFDGVFSASECESMWRLYLSPLNTKSPWSVNEVDNLVSLIPEMNESNWPEIAKRLNTGRSGYQCFMLYVQRLKSHYLADNFTYEDDVRLLQIIQKSQIGSYISWSKVSYYFNQFPKRRIFTRYKYLTNAHTYKKLMPAKRKMASESDSINRIEGNKRVSKNRKRSISSFEVPFSRTEDTMLVNLVQTYGVKSWMMFSRNHFQMRRSADQLRHRFRFILDYHVRRNFVKNNEQYKTVVKQMIREIQAGNRIEIGDFHPIPMSGGLELPAPKDTSGPRRGRKPGVIVKPEEHVDRRLLGYFSGHFSLTGRRKKITPEQFFPAIVNCLRFLRVPSLQFAQRPAPEMFTYFDNEIIDYMKNENERLNQELAAESDPSPDYLMPFNLSSAIGTRYLINYLQFDDDSILDPNDFADLESDSDFQTFYDHFETLFECGFTAVVPKRSVDKQTPRNLRISQIVDEVTTNLETES